MAHRLDALKARQDIGHDYKRSHKYCGVVLPSAPWHDAKNSLTNNGASSSP
jgi:hypothetical protein